MAGKLKLTGKLAVKAQKMLKDVCKILDENNIPYVLEGGTLLGIIRENRLLPWDNDVDLTITEDHLEKLIKIRYKFWLAGYRTRIRRSIKDMPHFPKGSVRLMKIQTRWFIFKGVSLLDIFVKKKIGDQYYWTVGINNPVLKSAPYFYYENLDRYAFDGYHYLVPLGYKSYLQHRYGDWETPVKEYDFKKNDNAIVTDEKEVNS
jgi:phosphorylcholine metabolism protein LicD